MLAGLSASAELLVKMSLLTAVCTKWCEQTFMTIFDFFEIVYRNFAKIVARNFGSLVHLNGQSFPSEKVKTASKLTHKK